ncbi:hypothetical protein ACP70R_000082 [Stipagrostis hirtigluma subsp. patula]
MPSSANPASSAGAGGDPPSRSYGLDSEKTLTVDILNYTETKDLASGSCIKSARFAVGGRSWYIAYYPNGMRAGTTASVSLYLQLDDAAAAATDGADGDVKIRYKFILPAAEGSPRFISGEVECTVGRRRNAHGFERFVTRDELENSGCIRNDRLRIRCDLAVLGRPKKSSATKAAAPAPAPSAAAAVPPASRRLPEPSVDVKPLPPPPLSASPEPSARTARPPAPRDPSAATAQPPAPPPPSPPTKADVDGAPPPSPQEPDDVDALLPSDLSADLGQLLMTKEGADVELEVDGRVFAAHKCVLAARSPVFKASFFGLTKEEDTSFVRIDDMNANAFMALLCYIYTDSLPEMETEEVAAMAQGLLAAADRFDIRALKSITENELCAHIAVGTALDMLVLAEQYQCCKLKDTCLRFITSRENCREVMATDGVEHLAKSCPFVVRELVTKILDTI